VSKNDLVSKNDPVPKKHDFAAVLASTGVSSKSSHDFFDGKPKTRPSDVKRPPVRSTLYDPARHDLACRPGMGRSGFTETAVAFVGPAGAGKTTTIMKLALMHGLLMSRPVRLFSIDPDRIGAAVRLKRFAQILNIEFAEFETLTGLTAAIEKPADGLTLIDTAGYSKYEKDALVESANCLLDHAKVETQLVLRVDRKSADNLAAVRFFAPFQAARVVLTAFDECSDNSDLVSLVEAAELPVSFLGVGQRIPEDLEPARGERLAELIRSGWPELVRSAA
jgi:flagellar biosynthesis GTPase FlhF